MSDPIQQLADALATDDTAAAAELLEEVGDTMEVRRQRQIGYQPLAIKTRQQPDSGSDLRSACTELLTQTTVASNAHAELGIKASGYFHGEVTGTAAAQAARAASDAYAQFTNARQIVESADVDVGPVVGLFGPTDIDLPKGVSTPTDVSVENIGTAPTGDLTVALKTAAALKPAPSTLDGLDAGASATVTLSGVPAQSGTFSASLVVTGDQVADELSIQFTIFRKADYIERAIASVEGIDELLTQHIEQDGEGNSKGAIDGLHDKIRTAINRLEQILNQIENEGQESAINNEIQSVELILGAFANQADAQAGKGLPEGVAARLRLDASSVIEMLATARRAAQ